MNPLVQWVSAREALRKAKESGAPQPWTDDPILQQYRFTNVRRRDDRVSQWLRTHVLTGANLNVGFCSFLQFTAFCRWNNWPPLIGEIMRQGLYPANKIKWNKVIEVMDVYKLEHKKAWTGAYMIPAKGCAKGGSKAKFIVENVIVAGIGEITKELEKAIHTGYRKEVWATLMALPNWGSFMSGQVVDDWSWTLLLSKAKDTYTWASQGPGSLRGFNRLLGLEPLRKRHSEEEWCSQLQAWRLEIIKELGPEYKDLTLMDLQSCLCETDKWLRVKNGQGRPRSVYKPETAYDVQRLVRTEGLFV